MANMQWLFAWAQLGNILDGGHIVTGGIHPPQTSFADPMSGNFAIARVDSPRFLATALSAIASGFLLPAERLELPLRHVRSLTNQIQIVPRIRWILQRQPVLFLLLGAYHRQAKAQGQNHR